MLSRIETEKRVVERMIRLYCDKHEGNHALCADCEELLKYSHQRLTHCPHGELKPTCRKCTIHCYKPRFRKKMKEIMRFSGPRMLLYAPKVAVNHFIRELF